MIGAPPPPILSPRSRPPPQLEDIVTALLEKRFRDVVAACKPLLSHGPTVCGNSVRLLKILAHVHLGQSSTALQEVGKLDILLSHRAILRGSGWLTAAPQLRNMLPASVLRELDRLVWKEVDKDDSDEDPPAGSSAFIAPRSSALARGTKRGVAGARRRRRASGSRASSSSLGSGASQSTNSLRSSRRSLSTSHAKGASRIAKRPSLSHVTRKADSGGAKPKSIKARSGSMPPAVPRHLRRQYMAAHPWSYWGCYPGQKRSEPGRLLIMAPEQFHDRNDPYGGVEEYAGKFDGATDDEEAAWTGAAAGASAAVSKTRHGARTPAFIRALKSRREGASKARSSKTRSAGPRSAVRRGSSLSASTGESRSSSMMSGSTDYCGPIHWGPPTRGRAGRGAAPSASRTRRPSRRSSSVSDFTQFSSVSNPRPLTSNRAHTHDHANSRSRSSSLTSRTTREHQEGDSYLAAPSASAGHVARAGEAKPSSSSSSSSSLSSSQRRRNRRGSQVSLQHRLDMVTSRIVQHDATVPISARTHKGSGHSVGTHKSGSRSGVHSTARSRRPSDSNPSRTRRTRASSGRIPASRMPPVTRDASDWQSILSGSNSVAKKSAKSSGSSRRGPSAFTSPTFGGTEATRSAFEPQLFEAATTVTGADSNAPSGVLYFTAS